MSATDLVHDDDDVALNRADGLERQILSGKMCCTKSRGRQSTKYTDSLNNYATRKEPLNNELIRRTDDREEWKAMTDGDGDGDGDLFGFLTSSSTPTRLVAISRTGPRQSV